MYPATPASELSKISTDTPTDFADLDISDPNGTTTEHITYGLTPNSSLTRLEAAAYKGTLARVQALIAHGASVPTGRPLHYACHNPNPDEALAIVEYLIDAGCDVNQMDAGDERRNTGRPLHWAAQVEGTHGDRIIELLVKAGAGPDGRSVQGFTPLGRAQELGLDSEERRRLLRDCESVAPWGVRHSLMYRMSGYEPVSPGKSAEEMRAFKKAVGVDQESDGKGVSFGLVLG